MNDTDSKGMKVLPNPLPDEMTGSGKVLVVSECYCPNAHSLLFPRARFNGHPGIIIKVKGENKEGMVVFSPIYGDKTRVALDVDLVEGEIVTICCPYCEGEFPVFGSCTCGAQLISLFTSPISDPANSIGICNRVGCVHSEVKRGGDMMVLTMLNDLKDL